MRLHTRPLPDAEYRPHTPAFLRSLRKGLPLIGGLAVCALTPQLAQAEESGTQSQAISGIEGTSEDGLFLTLIEPEAELVEVQKEDKTAFVGVRRAGEAAITMCVYVSRWEVEQKFKKRFLPSEADNPCTVERMNALKNRYKALRKFNSRDAVDGTYFTRVINTDSCDTRLWRSYNPGVFTPMFISPSIKPKFSKPVILNNGQPARLGTSVHYRAESLDGKAALVRIDKDNIEGVVDVDDEEGLTPDQLKAFDTWFYTDRDCYEENIDMNSPKRPKGARRGHRPSPVRTIGETSEAELVGLP